MSKLKIGNGPLTNSIFIGTVNKNGMWGKNKTNVTVDVLCVPNRGKL